MKIRAVWITIDMRRWLNKLEKEYKEARRNYSGQQVPLRLGNRMYKNTTKSMIHGLWKATRGATK